MPAPGPQIQIFGRRDSRATQKALRFFKERRASVSFVDVAVRPPAVGELRRFSDRVGASSLLDREGRVYRELGMGYLKMGDDEIIGRLVDDPRLLRLPLVRFARDVAVGPDEAAWRRLLAAASAASTA